MAPHRPQIPLYFQYERERNHPLPRHWEFLVLFPFFLEENLSTNDKEMNFLLRTQVLSLYKTILKTGKSWQGMPEESQYIMEEAKSLFRLNKNLTDKEQIKEKIFEASSRLELGNSLSTCIITSKRCITKFLTLVFSMQDRVKHHKT